MFGDLKTDKLRLSYKRDEGIDLKQTTNSLNVLFHKACTYTKMNKIYHSITPTKLIRNPNVFHNLQMPRERKLLNAIEKSSVPVQETKVTELHLTKDILVSKNPDEFIELIAGMKLSYLIPVYYSSNIEGKSVYLVPPKREIDGEEHTGYFIIKFYNKTQEYLQRNASSIVKLNEYLSIKERIILGEAYNIEENTLDIRHLNILRVEIVFKTSKVLKPIIEVLSNNTEANELTLTSILDKLRTGSLYIALDEVFNNTLQKYVFYQDYTVNELTDGCDRIKIMAVDLLARSDEYYHYKAIFNDLGMKNQFSVLQKLVRKIRPESELYNELYEKLFGSSLNMKSRHSKVAEEVKTPCKACSLLNLQYFILIYDVPILDDS